MVTISDLKDAPTQAFNMFNQLADMGHEQVVFCHDEASGLRAIIAIHNTVLGPALGGCRMWSYANDETALIDALRLSRGMSYKASISGINLGGGKSVIIGNSKTDKSEKLFRRFGKFIESLSGKYITAEDVGTSTKDMEYVAQETDYVGGVPEYMGGGGDPSPFTAYGVYLGMKASAKEVYGTDSLSGKTIGVQGVGSVGESLVELASKEGANILITDIDEPRLKEVSDKYGASVVGLDEIYDVDMDIYAPCALGATINDDTIDRLKCAIVAGAANNQLQDEVIHANGLKDKGILYAPDFLINAGGVINVYIELGEYNESRSYAACERIYERTTEIIKTAQINGITTHAAAMKIAEQRIEDIAKIKARF